MGPFDIMIHGYSIAYALVHGCDSYVFQTAYHDVHIINPLNNSVYEDCVIEICGLEIMDFYLVDNFSQLYFILMFDVIK